jgi:type II secretory pathway pseudopilin PulG
MERKNFTTCNTPYMIIRKNGDPSMYRKRHPITLLEIMIVILLIGLIGGVLSYNLKGTLDRGKKFRSEEGVKRLTEILEIEIERGAIKLNQLTGPENFHNVKQCIIDSGFIAQKDAENFLYDGWKEPYIIEEANNEIQIYSSRMLPSER